MVDILDKNLTTLLNDVAHKWCPLICSLRLVINFNQISTPSTVECFITNIWITVTSLFAQKMRSATHEALSGCGRTQRRSLKGFNGTSNGGAGGTTALNGKSLRYMYIHASFFRTIDTEVCYKIQQRNDDDKVNVSVMRWRQNDKFPILKVMPRRLLSSLSSSA